MPQQYWEDVDMGPKEKEANEKLKEMQRRVDGGPRF